MREAPAPSEAPRRGRAALLRSAAFGDAAPTTLARAAQVSLQLLLVVGAIAVVGFVVVHLRLVVVPTIAALFLATVLSPASEWLRRRGLPPAAAALLVMVAAIALLGGLTALLAPQVADELGDVGVSVRQGITEIGSWLAQIGITEQEIDDAIDSTVESLRENVGGIGQGVVSGALFVTELIAGLLLMIVLVFFFLKDGERMWRWLVEFLPARRREAADEVGRRSWSALGHYLRGVALVALFDAVAIGIALAILGVPLVLPLAVLTFFAAFFPLVGAVTAGFLAALVALVSNGVVTALIVVAVITAIQQSEGNVMYPVVVGRQIRLHPVAILLVLTAGAVVAGIIGALFAVPAAAVTWTAIKYLRGEEDERGPPDPARE